MRRALGRGLSQLLASEASGGNILPISSIRANASQPRRHFDEDALRELADSIRVHGILQPITVRPVAEDQYEIIAGERRWRAAQMAGLEVIPASIRSADELETLQLALVENIQREDIGPIECARAYKRLSEEFGLTQESISEKVGKARVSITNTMRLLKLPRRVQDGLEEQKLSEGHARALLQFESEAQMLAVYDQILTKGLNVREVEERAKKQSQPSKKLPQPPRENDDLLAAERALSMHLGAPVRIQPHVHGTGKITIQYFSDDDLIRIFDTLGINVP